MKTTIAVFALILGLTGCTLTKLHTAESSQKESFSKETETAYGKVESKKHQHSRDGSNGPGVTPFPYNRAMTHFSNAGPEHVEIPRCEICKCKEIRGDWVRLYCKKPRRPIQLCPNDEPPGTCPCDSKE